ncbi:hypothetical protein [Massilistercora timonensis]|uniref:hypothetical protein n=1 Tax=Massilistercora timonensis TaxID=2086584 RepID=UPI003AB1D3A2
MSEEYKVTIPIEEYRELCWTVGKMAAVINYLNGTEYIEKRVLQAIIGMDYFQKDGDE